MNHTEMPLANLIGHGDVSAYSLDEIRSFCDVAVSQQFFGWVSESETTPATATYSTFIVDIPF